MKRYLMPLLVSMFCMAFCIQCDKITESNNKSAKIILDGQLVEGFTNYDSPKLSGTVKNVGNATGYNCMVEITAYSGNIIIDVAKGFPADLGDIPVGAKAAFDAIFFDINTHYAYDSCTTKISYLTRD